MDIKNRKREAHDFGLEGEKLAAEEYMRRGYTVLEKRWRLGKTEIDLITQKDDVVVISEVKSRKTSEEDAVASVTKDKRKRMARAADYYIRRLPGDNSYRFDIVACYKEDDIIKIEIFEDAFLATDLF